MSIWYHYKKITGLLIGSIILIGFATSLSSQSLSSGDGTARIIGSLESPNNQYDTFLPNLPGSQSSLGLYVVYGPQLEQRTPTIYFDRSSCNTPEDFDFCFDVSYVHREDYFAIFQDLPRTVRDIKLIGPYQFSLLSSNEELATFEQRWYYILYDWYYTRPDGSRSQTFTDQTSCEAEANLVGTNLICKEFIGKYLRHSHYFETQEECLLEAVATTGDAQAQCYTTQIRNVQVLFEVPHAGIDGEFGPSPTRTLVGKNSAFLRGTIDTKGVPTPISVEVFGVPRYVLDSSGNPILNSQGFKVESQVNNSAFKQPYGNVFNQETLSLGQDPNIHILGTRSTTNPLMTNPMDPQPFTLSFNPETGMNATLSFSEKLKQDYIYYYRVFNPTYLPDDQTKNILETQPIDSNTRMGITYSQGWFTTGEVIMENGGEVLGGVIIDGSGNITLGTLEIEEIDGLVPCGKKDQVRYYYITESLIEGETLGTRQWSQFYANQDQCMAAYDAAKAAGITVVGDACFENTMCTYNDFIGLIDRIISYLLLLIGPLAAIMFAYAGFLLVTSHENAEKRTKARKIFLNTAIGIVIILLAWVAVAQFLHMLGLDPDYVLLKIGS